MRYILYKVIGVVFLCVTIGAAFTVSGTCSDFITGSPIDTCRVLLEAYSPGTESDSARSDADGLYSFENAEAGVYKIVVDDSRYSSDTVWATIVMLNQNGDSCDYLYNVPDDPRIADSTTGQLCNGSVCIGAASDGTNIGVYQGETAGVEKVPEVAGRDRNRPVRVKFGNRSITVPVMADHLHSTVLTVRLLSLDGRCVFAAEGDMHRTENTISVYRSGIMAISSGCYLLQIYGDGYRYSVPVVLNNRFFF